MEVMSCSNLGSRAGDWPRFHSFLTTGQLHTAQSNGSEGTDEYGSHTMTEGKKCAPLTIEYGGGGGTTHTGDLCQIATQPNTAAV